MENKISIAVGMSVSSKLWKNKEFTWPELVRKLSEGIQTGETLSEYMGSTKEERLAIKDVGGYVGGYLRKGRRHPQNVMFRQLVTLDIDFAHEYFWDDFQLQYDCAAVLHATHTHSKASPRFRLIIPLDREVSPDEYVAISRKIAGNLGIELFDNTTFETNRLMFWPSHPIDVPYYFEKQSGKWLSADEVLDSYIDWTDSSLWPTSEKKLLEVKEGVEKQEDPEIKKGIIGAFCRTYSISEGIERFLSEEYSKTDKEDRYTYTKGSTSSGLVVYEDKFAYSHHGTDPCGGKLCNIFDLVRIHKFGHLDSDKNNKASYEKMKDLVLEDSKSKKTLAFENIKDAKYEFEVNNDPENVEQEDLEWMKELEVNTRGKYQSSAINLNLIMRNDPRMKKVFRYNIFDGRKYVFGNLPWRKIDKPEPLRDVDFSGLRNYIESIYGISSSMKVEDSLELEFERNKFHPIRDYIRNLKWDGIKRIDSVLIEYFGAEDTVFTREAFRKFMVGSVARVFKPGIKFDLVLTLISKTQGTGKSSFFKAIGKDWFSDTFLTVQGKEAFEQLQGAWIIEMAELSGLRKAEVEAIKHYISKQEDSFRKAYGRIVEIHPRQCTFVATTNQSMFLRDPSGNRRFMPVDIHEVKLLDNKKLFDLITKGKEEIDQFWAEAYHLYKNKEPLYLSNEAEKLSEIEQYSHVETDSREGIIREYLERKFPEDWDSMDIMERKMYLEDPLSEEGTVKKDFVCIAEIWCEALGNKKENMNRYKTREINDIMRGIRDWDSSNSTKRFKIYGIQKFYFRK